MNREPHVVIVILTYNQKDFTLACLASLEKQEYPDFSIIVVDNNSTDCTCEAVSKHFAKVHIVRNDYNAGVAGGRNSGIRYAETHFDYKYLLILDNDTSVTLDALKLMVKKLETDTLLGAVSPKIYLMDEDRILDQAGGSIVNFFTGSTAKRGFGEYDSGQYDSMQTQKCLPSGACTLSRREAITACEGLDEIFNPYGFEDLDFSLRLKKAGYRVAYVPEAVIYHKGNKTGFAAYTESYADIKGRHLKIFLHRHANYVQLVCFYCLLPFLGLKTVLREVRKGNGKAVLRLFLSFAGISRK